MIIRPALYLWFYAQRPYFLVYITNGPSIGPDFGPYIGPKLGPRIERPHSAEGSSQIHEGPHRDHGHVLHKVQLIKSLNKNILIYLLTEPKFVSISLIRLSVGI